MEKHSNACLTQQDPIHQKVNYLITLWRSQRKILSQSLEDSFYADLTPLEVEPAPNPIKPLCEKLIDYVSTGHFEVYARLFQANSIVDKSDLELINGIYHNIKSSTDQALRFNDKYEGKEVELCDAQSSLSKDLAKLNQTLAIRFVLEEQMIEILYNSH